MERKIIILMIKGKNISKQINQSQDIGLKVREHELPQLN